jgi:hypothetical protein
MSRYINPVPQYLDGAGNPVCLGKLFFYESEQNVLKTTYADQAQQIPNTNPVLLGTDGRTPNTIYSGSARVVLTDCDGLQIWERDPVGGENSFADFGQWLDYISYDTNDIVELSGSFYISTTDGNQGNDPSLSAGSNLDWTLIQFLGLYNSTTTYGIGDIVNIADGTLWASQSTSNLANPPSSNNGTNWLPAVAGAKIPEVVALEVRATAIEVKTSTVIPHTTSGTFTAGGAINQIRDGGAFTMPLANAYTANTILVAELPKTFAASTPTLTRSASDLFRDDSGTDTSITWAGSARITFTTNGTDEWSL